MDYGYNSNQAMSRELNENNQLMLNPLSLSLSLLQPIETCCNPGLNQPLHMVKKKKKKSVSSFVGFDIEVETKVAYIGANDKEFGE